MSSHVIGSASESGDIPIDLVDEAGFDRWLAEQPESTRRWVRSSGFEARPHTRCLVPDSRHEIGSVLAGVSDRTDPWCCADLPASLPARRFRIRTALEPADLERVAVGWGLGAYRFDRYRKRGEKIRGKRNAGGRRFASIARRRSGPDARSRPSPSSAISSTRRPATSSPATSMTPPARSPPASEPNTRASRATISSRTDIPRSTRSGGRARSPRASSISGGGIPPPRG